MVATATLDLGLLPLPRFARRVNINTEDEAALAQLLNLTFIEARRVCLERPFQDPGDLLKVRGMSRGTIQQWESDGIEILFEDPFLAFEKSQHSASIADLPSPLPSNPPSSNLIKPSPAPQNLIQSFQSTANFSQPPPSSRRPPLPRPRGKSDSLRATGLPYSSSERRSSNGRESSAEKVGGAGVGPSPRIEGSLHSSFSSSADVEKLVALVYRQQDARLKRIAGSRMQRTVTMVIQAWSGHLRERRRLDEKEFGIILRRLRTSLKDTLSEWMACARKCNRLRKLGVIMLLRVLARYRTTAFQHWRTMCGGMSAMGAMYSNLLARCFTRCLAAHFQAWSDHASRSNYRATAILVAVSTGLHMLLRRAWDSWAKSRDAQKHIRTMVLKVMSKWLNVRMGEIVDAWRERAALAEDLAMMRTRNEATRTAGSLKGCLRHWCCMCSKQVRHTLHRKIVMVLKGLMAEAFDDWHEHVVNARRWATALLRAVTKVQRSMASATFFRWNWFVRRSLRLHETGIHILVNSMERNLRMIFEGWKRTSNRSQLWLHVQRKVVRIDTKTLYTQHFNAWRGTVGDEEHQLAKIAEGWKEYKNPAGREGAMLVRVLYAWRTVAEESATLRHAGLKVLLRWLAFGVKEAFWRWQITASLVRVRSIQVQRGVKRGELTRFRCLLLRAFWDWRDTRVHSANLANTMMHIGLRWTTCELSAIFRNWRAITKLMRQSEIHYNRARRRVIWNRKRHILQQWSFFTYEARRLWHAGSVILSRWSTGVLAACLSHWMLYGIEEKQKISKIKMTIAKICSRDALFAFQAWVVSWQEDKHKEPIESAKMGGIDQWPPSSVVTVQDFSVHAHLQAEAQYASDKSTRAPDGLDSYRTAALPSTIGESGSELSQAELSQAASMKDDGDPWSRVVAALDSDQRMGIHMLSMQRTWETMWNIFEAWRHNASWRPMCEAPSEPDFSPSKALSAPAPDVYCTMPAMPVASQNGLDMSLPGTPYVEQASATHWDAAGRQAPSTSPMSPHSLLSPSLPAVVMSNFPRQQFTPVPAGEEDAPAHETSPRTSPWSPPRLAPPPSRSAGASASVTHPSLSRIISPRIMMSPQGSARSSRSSMEEKGAKLGQPVTQSLTPRTPKRPASNSILYSSSAALFPPKLQDQEPMIYLL